MTRDYSRFIANPVWARLLPDTIGRLEFFVRSMLLDLGTFPLMKSLLHVGDPDRSIATAFAIGLTGLFAHTVLMLCSIVAPRLRDLQWNRKLIWLILVPYVNVGFWLVLLIVPRRSRR